MEPFVWSRHGEGGSYLGTAIHAWNTWYLVDIQIRSKGFCPAIRKSKIVPRPASLEFKTEVGESRPLPLLLGVWCTRGGGKVFQSRQGSSMEERIKCLQGSPIVVDGKGYAVKVSSLLLSSSFPTFPVTPFQAFGMPAPMESCGCQVKQRGAYWCQS